MLQLNHYLKVAITSGSVTIVLSSYKPYIPLHALNNKHVDPPEAIVATEASARD
ncbi:hypothetical protein [Wolbachia endosymbiont (group A) of Brachyopa scutellaris]|uniref:hypothetical protein n=1 Tax=Wolbachia endosymbiont (group A) of Brachyopa scutellaris TaxID=3066140 RepID=UPI0031335285